MYEFTTEAYCDKQPEKKYKTACCGSFDYNDLHCFLRLYQRAAKLECLKGKSNQTGVIVFGDAFKSVIVCGFCFKSGFTAKQQFRTGEKNADVLSGVFGAVFKIRYAND